MSCSITCGLYVNIVLGDYVRTILNLNDNSIDSDWNLDPREAFTSIFDPEGTPKGIGNQVSAEFNFIYRWHCAISNRDEVWMSQFMTEIYGGPVDASKSLSMHHTSSRLADYEKVRYLPKNYRPHCETGAMHCQKIRASGSSTISRGKKTEASRMPPSSAC